MIYQMTLGLFIDYKKFLVGPKKGPKKTFIQCKTNIILSSLHSQEYIRNFHP